MSRVVFHLGLFSWIHDSKLLTVYCWCTQFFGNNCSAKNHNVWGEGGRYLLVSLNMYRETRVQGDSSKSQLKLWNYSGFQLLCAYTIIFV